MWRRWDDYDPTRPLRPWLAGIVFKVAHRHRLRRQRELAHGVLEEVDPAPSLEEQLEISRQRALVLQALGSLAERHRAVLVLHEMDGLTLDQVADVLEVPRSTAFSRLRVARARLAKAIRRSIDRTRRILLPRATPWLLEAAAVMAAALVVLAQPAPPSSLERGLVGHWRFDETAGRLATDNSGHGNHCLLRRRPAAAAWAHGRTGGAIQLEGDGWLECPPSASLARPSVELSVAAWMRLPEGRSGVQTLLSRQQAGDVRDDFFLGVFARTPVDDELVVNSRTWSTRVAVPLPGARGRWIHVAATQARSGATTLFVDGKAVATRWSKRPQVTASGGQAGRDRGRRQRAGTARGEPAV